MPSQGAERIEAENLQLKEEYFRLLHKIRDNPALFSPLPSHSGPGVLFDPLAAGTCTHCCLLKVTC